MAVLGVPETGAVVLGMRVMVAELVLSPATVSIWLFSTVLVIAVVNGVVILVTLGCVMGWEDDC